MQTTEILEVRVDEHGRLCVMPQREAFAHIYRAAAEVEWDDKRRCLCSPAPREWTIVRWYQQILEAVRDEYGQRLMPTPATAWVNVTAADRQAMESLVLGPRTGAGPDTSTA